MIIDLDSWELGYEDGHLGRLLQCPEQRDLVSYSSGYWQGHAARAGTWGTARRLRRRVAAQESSRSIR